MALTKPKNLEAGARVAGEMHRITQFLFATMEIRGEMTSIDKLRY